MMSPTARRKLLAGPPREQVAQSLIVCLGPAYRFRKRNGTRLPPRYNHRHFVRRCTTNCSSGDRTARQRLMKVVMNLAAT